MREFNISLHCGDGAVRGGFIAGAMVRLLEEYPDYLANLSEITASSASVGSALYFLSDLKDNPGREIWIDALSSKNFIDYDKFSRFLDDKPIYDIEYMARKVFEKDHPLNIENIVSSSTKLYFPIYNVDEGTIELFTNQPSENLPHDDNYIVRSIENKDIYEVIMAANAAPFVYDNTVNIGGVAYIDAAAWMPLVFNTPTNKCTKRIVIVTKSDSSLKRRLNYMFLGFIFPFILKLFRSQMLPLNAYFQYGRKPWVIDKIDRVLEKFSQKNDLIVVRPRAKLGSQTDNSKETLQSNFEHGYDLIGEMKPEFDIFFNVNI